MKRFMGLKKAVQALAVNRFFCIENITGASRNTFL